MAFTLGWERVIAMRPQAAINDIPAQRVPAPTIHFPAGEHALEIAVIFTAVEQTIEALLTAASLAHGLDAVIRVIVPQIVPFPLSLDEPPVDRDFTERRLRALLPSGSIPTWVDVRLCRERSAILNVLDPKSLVVIGVSKHWWPHGDRRLARLLRARGHHVVLTERGRGHHA
jgi:hypothetical protein